jgi:uncharacterized lipoprotein YddW (UPF0748 family)
MRGLKVFLCLVSFLIAGKGVAADKDYPKQEIRAVWLTTIYGLDWPTRPARDEAGWARQRQDLCEMLNRLKEANFNTVFVQSRLRGDVIFQSDIEPASRVFTGEYGLYPDYDPLAFVIEECHKRGMECHAFFVTFPVGSPKSVEEQGGYSVVNRRRSLCVQYKNEWYLDPGLPGTSDYILSLVEEIVSNYDVDGIQFDYIRYPDGARNFPDQESYSHYGNGKNIEDWRRENINRLVSRIHDWVKQEKPWVQVSSSPLGKYSKIPQNPNAGWTAYDDVYQDPKAWLKAGKQDMIVPMMYYRNNDFYPFVVNWMEHINRRNMVMGLGAYRLNKSEGDWPLSDIKDQIKYGRQQGVNGCAFFRAQFVVKNEKGLYEELKNNLFKYPAQLPPLTWMSDTETSPKAPKEILVEYEKGRLKLSWEADPEDDNCTYTVYYSSIDSIRMDRAQSILATGLRKTEVSLPISANAEKGYLFSVTVSNRYRIESRPSYETYYYLTEYEK